MVKTKSTVRFEPMYGELLLANVKVSTEVKRQASASKRMRRRGQRQYFVGEVAAVPKRGRAQAHDGTQVAALPKVGERVIFGEWRQLVIKVQGKSYSLVPIENVLGILR